MQEPFDPGGCYRSDDPNAPYERTVECPECEGQGWVLECGVRYTCEACEGYGTK